MWVFDATPLIYLAKVEELDLVRYLDERRVIPELVYAEVVERGIEEGYPDARRIERCVEDDVFDVVDVEETALTTRLADNPNLSDADIAVLGFAAMHEGVAVMDESYGRVVASTEDIDTRGTAYLIISLAAQDVLGTDDARSVVDGMLEAGWYCAPDAYAKIVQKLDEIAK